MEVVFSEKITINNDDCVDSDASSDATQTPHITIHKNNTYSSTTYSIEINGINIYDWFFDTTQDCCETTDENMFVGMIKYDSNSYTIDIPSTPFTISLDLLIESSTYHGDEKTEVYLRLSYAGGDNINIMFSNCHNGYYAHPVRLSKNGKTLWHSFI